MRDDIDVLLVGPDFFHFAQSIENSLAAFGLDVSFLPYPDLESRRYYLEMESRSLLNKIGLRFDDIDYLEYWEKEIDLFNEAVLEEACNWNPELIFVLKGDLIRPSTVKRLNQKSETVLWCYDSAARFEYVRKGAAYYDRVFLYEKSDLDRIGVDDAQFLPMAYDPDIYRPLEVEESVDVVFIGRMYPNRKEILTEILKSLPHLNLRIWSKEWNWYNPRQLFERYLSQRRLYDHITNSNIEPRDANWEYNSAKICLNIHHEQQEHSLNPRTYEILGAGSFQLVDFHPLIDEAFVDGEQLVSYGDSEELIEQISYYLEHADERDVIAENGATKVQDEDTYHHRIQRILSDIDV